MTTLHSPIDFLDIAVTAAIDAGKAIMSHYEETIVVNTKSDQSPVTAADLAAHRCILSQLAETGLPAISEEGGVENFEIRKNWNTYWLIDPLDGTKEFIHRNGEFTVNIALIENHIPVLGVVFAPATGELYAGCVGSGTWYIPHADALTESDIDYSSFRLIPDSSSGTRPYTIAVSRSHLDQKTLDYIEQRKLEKGHVATLSAGSSMKFCLVAHGKADEYPRFGPTNEWDTAAGHAVLLSVGKGVYTFPEKDPFTYNKSSLLNGPFLAH